MVLQAIIETPIGRRPTSHVASAAARRFRTRSSMSRPARCTGRVWHARSIANRGKLVWHPIYGRRKAMHPVETALSIRLSTSRDPCTKVASMRFVTAMFHRRWGLHLHRPDERRRTPEEVARASALFRRNGGKGTGPWLSQIHGSPPNRRARRDRSSAGEGTTIRILLPDRQAIRETAEDEIVPCGGA